MTVTAVRKDPQRLTLTIEAEFAASVERIWQLWADPRQLERWWGPPTYPATVTKHDLAPGRRIERDHLDAARLRVGRVDAVARFGGARRPRGLARHVTPRRGRGPRAP